MATTNPDPVVNNNTKHRTFSTSAPHEQHTYNKEASAYDKTRRTGLGPNASGDVPGNNLYPDAHVQDMLEMQGDNNTAFGDKSPGVRRIEAIGSCFTSWHRWVLFTFIFLVAYSYGLDGTVRYTYQATALSALDASAQISTVTVVRSVVAAAAQPAYAKISDYFGRVSILFISVLFYVIGTIVQATAKDLGAFAGGAVIYQFGYTGAQLLLEVLIADLTSLRNRLFFSFIPAGPFIINAWVSGTIAQKVIIESTWQWGIGMWGIIFPVCCIPLFFALIDGERRAKKRGLLEGIPSPLKTLGRGSLWIDFFWQIDLVGILLLAGLLSFILVPLTLAGGTTSIWGTANIIAPLVIGIVIFIPAFVIWELRGARHPLVPFRILKDRQILAGLAIAMLLNTTWYTQGDYLYYTLVISFNRDIESATRVQNVYSFCSVVVGFTLGFLVRYVRRLKPFIVAGTLLFLLAFGLLYRYRGGSSINDFAGIVAAEVVLGIAGGLFSYPTQALVQSAVQHERTAVITALYLSLYSVGSALGNTIAGAIWTNTLPGRLLSDLTAANIPNAATVAATVYANPLGWIVTNPMGTPAREAVNSAYREVQRYLTTAGLCLSVLLIIASLCLRNPRLGDTQSFANAEGYDAKSIGSGVEIDTSREKDAETIVGSERRKKRFGLF